MQSRATQCKAMQSNAKQSNAMRLHDSPAVSMAGCVKKKQKRYDYDCGGDDYYYEHTYCDYDDDY